MAFLGRIQRKLPPTKYIQKSFFHLTESRHFKSDKIREILTIPLQTEKPKPVRKISVIGASGSVGTACAYNLLLKDTCDEIVLYDIPERKEKLCGEALDYSHLMALTNHPKVRICLDGENTRDSDLLIISASVCVPPEDYIKMLHGNVKLFKTLIPKVAALSPEAVILVISNPVDLMTYAAWKYSGFDKNRVIGTGTELDSSRFRFLIGKRLGISPKSINAWIIGQHAKGVPCWSSVDIAGTRLREIDECVATEGDEDNWCSLYDQVVKAETLLVNLKGNSNWAVSTAAEKISAAVLENKKTVHAVSVNVQGMYQIETDVFFSLPVILGNRGVIQIVKQNLDPTELSAIAETCSYLNCLKNSVCW